MKILTILIALFISVYAIELSKDEKLFIQNHPEIKVGIDIKWQTIDAIDKNGNHVGIASDYLKIISRESGIMFKFIALDSFDNVLKSIQDKKIDMISGIVQTPSRDKYLKFSDPYISIPYDIFTRDDDPKYFNMKDLNGKKVVALKGFMINDWIKENYPAIRVVDSYTIYGGLEKVYRSEASAFINDYPSTAYVLENTFLPNMIVNAPITKLAHVQIRMGIRNDYAVLQKIINKINASLSEEDVERLRQKWLSNSRISMLNFSSKETLWLDSHKEITFSADPSWLPFEGYDEKTMQFFGIGNEILTIISSRTGITFKLIPSTSWNDAKEKLKDNRVQMLPTVSSSNDLQKYVNLSKPYLSLPYMLYGFENLNINSLSNIKNAKVAINEDSKVQKYLKDKYPDIEVIVVQNRENLINKLLNKEVDYFVTDSASASFLINNKNINNIIGLEKLNINYEPHIAISKELGETALKIINKAIEGLSEAEIKQAYNKWIFVKSSEDENNNIILMILSSIFVIILLILFVRAK